MTADRQRQLDRRRLINAWLLTALLYALVILVAVLLNLRFLKELSDNPGPVNVRMGALDGVDIPSPPPSPAVEPSPEPSPSAEPSPEPRPTTSASTQASPKPSTKPSPKPSSQPTTSPAPDQSPAVTPLLSSAPSAAVQAEVKLPKGRDNGNTYDTSFYNVKGSVGRVLGSSVSLYMPLPQQVLGSLHDAIGTGKLNFPSRPRQLEIFESWYVRNGNNWQLRVDTVPVEQRDQLWAILEGAGYNLSQADYRYKNLRPVILEFTLGKSDTGPATVKEVRVIQSSGDGAVDDAVIYGFRRATFANKTSDEIKGRYSYFFE